MLRPLRLLLVAILTVHFVSGCSTEPERTLPVRCMPRSMRAWRSEPSLTPGRRPPHWSIISPPLAIELIRIPR